MSSRHYQLVLLWIRDAAKFARYGELVRPIVERYRAAAERQWTPTEVHAEGLVKPDLVNLVYSQDREAHERFFRDPEFRAIVHLRAESIDMISVEGTPLAPRPGGIDVIELEPVAPPERVYLIEVARFGERGRDAHARYEADAEAVMARHGYRVERRLAPTASTGFGFEAELVKVAYFESAAALAAFHADPEHPRLEREYAAVVARSVWIVGGVLRRST